MESIAIQSNEQRSFQLLTGLRIVAIISIGRLVFELFRYSLLRKIVNGVPISGTQFRLVERIEFYSWILQILVLAICTVFFIRWMYVAYQNLLQFPIVTSKIPLVMSIVGWLIPVINLWFPYQIMAQIVRNYERILIKEKFLRLSPQRHSTTGWWWITWVLASILHFFSLSIPLEESITGVMLMVISLLFYSIMAFLGIRMLIDLRMMEQGISEIKNVAFYRDTDEDLLDNL